MASCKVCTQKGVKDSGVRFSMALGPGGDEAEGIKQLRKGIKWYPGGKMPNAS